LAIVVAASIKYKVRLDVEVLYPGEPEREIDTHVLSTYY
jgi:hypothetical protein